MATTPAEEPAVAAGPRQLVTNQGKGFPLPADEHCRAASSEPTQQQAWDLGNWRLITLQYCIGLKTRSSSRRQL